METRNEKRKKDKKEKKDEGFSLKKLLHIEDEKDETQEQLIDPRERLQRNKGTLVGLAGRTGDMAATSKETLGLTQQLLQLAKERYGSDSDSDDEKEEIVEEKPKQKKPNTKERFQLRSEIRVKKEETRKERKAKMAPVLDSLIDPKKMEALAEEIEQSKAGKFFNGLFGKKTKKPPLYQPLSQSDDFEDNIEANVQKASQQASKPSDKKSPVQSGNKNPTSYTEFKKGPSRQKSDDDCCCIPFWSRSKKPPIPESELFLEEGKHKVQQTRRGMK